MRILLALACLLTTATASRAADLSVQLRTATGEPVADAVVTWRPAAGAAPVASRSGYAMSQQNIRFEPGVLVVPVGATVQFPNKDKVRHHVYSFSKPKRFELKLYGRDESRTIVFDKPGVVAIGCNIHDVMSGHVVVVETPHVARSDPQGRTTLTGLPAGAGTLTVWHPRLKSAQSGVSQAVTLPAGVRQVVTLDLRAGV